MAAIMPATAKLMVGSTVNTDTGVKWSSAMSGAMHGRDLYAEPMFTIGAKFDYISEADAEALEEFLDTNRNVLIEIVLRQYTYHANLISEIDRSYMGGDGVVSLSATFKGKRV